MAGVFLLTITALLAVAFIWIDRPPTPIKAREARHMIHKGEILYVVDVRDDHEWANGHYSAATHIPLSHLQQRLPDHVRERGDSILFYCLSGTRARQAAKIAQELGYIRVWYLAEGDYTELEHRPRFYPA